MRPYRKFWEKSDFLLLKSAGKLGDGWSWTGPQLECFMKQSEIWQGAWPLEFWRKEHWKRQFMREHYNNTWWSLVHASKGNKCIITYQTRGWKPQVGYMWVRKHHRKKYRAWWFFPRESSLGPHQILVLKLHIRQEQSGSGEGEEGVGWLALQHKKWEITAATKHWWTGAGRVQSMAKGSF